ncbi:hypothetical protein [Mycolicibacterium brisbanense]|uniref:Scaffolding protein n=1 Tax=Mycolicibacterium brisbanense TaxID=146020 RepID=A0A100VZL4_9MYCO|nr:hypothetical protein [Mycolicibacterium brisbanense]MCV7156140.1 hypothetical protein [Mycolicibacterium brisbanense]GAS88897.1 uncharacterized protein RMCB_2993 [Mycolicibacterium brisbanense]
MSDTQTGPDGLQGNEINPAEVTTTEGDPGAAEGDSGADTFPRKVVEDLRRENAGYRDRAKTAEARTEELARALFTARVAATGKLADATDLEYVAELLDDAEGLASAIESLTDAKPHLKARKLSGSIGQGLAGGDSGQFSLLDRLKGSA